MDKHDLIAARIKNERALANAKIKNIELVRKHNLDALRPHLQYRAEVSYCLSENSYKCQLPLVFDEDETAIPVVAYGASPSEACDNFDHIWVYGNGHREGSEE